MALYIKILTDLLELGVIAMSRYITPKIEVKDLLFVSDEESEIKCGKCEKPMSFTVYYKDKETYDFLVCKGCEVYLQRIITEE
ncbi:MAG: hypothetical protein KGD64_06365 [Candidatus Heimdallarchaeota archaeon]|nr:hypothetical protein [Candidatus Heimdallarchaeota archaeon]